MGRPPLVFLVQGLPFLGPVLVTEKSPEFQIDPKKNLFFELASSISSISSFPVFSYAPKVNIEENSCKNNLPCRIW